MTAAQRRHPRSAAPLAQAVEGSVGYFWNVTRSQVYRELHALAATGLVAEGETGPRERRPYTITPAGGDAFVSWIAREPGPELIRFPLLLTLFFGDQLAPDRLDLFLKVHRLRHEQRLARYRELLARLGAAAPYPAHTLRFGIEYEQAVLRWFDALADFARAARDGPGGAGEATTER